MNKCDNIILTDVDGVLLNWEYAFNVWLEQHGWTPTDDRSTLLEYDMHLKYGVSKAEMKQMVRFFNQSAAIGYLPPLRDAMHYVDLLHRKHGYRFHVITSLSLDPSAGLLRTRNLQKLFGETVFERFVYLDTGADKDEALAEYKDTQCYWIEDKVENAEAGFKAGLEPILIEHGHNMDTQTIPVMPTWKHVYEHIVGE